MPRDNVEWRGITLFYQVLKIFRDLFAALTERIIGYESLQLDGIDSRQQITFISFGLEVWNVGKPFRKGRIVWKQRNHITLTKDRSYTLVNRDFLRDVARPL